MQSENAPRVICHRSSRIFNPRILTLIASMILSTSFSSPASALPLGSVDGNNEFQSRSGNAVNSICAQMANAGFTRATAGNGGDLFRRCNEYVQNALNVNISASNPDSYGFDASELNAAIGQVIHDEAPAAGKSSVETSTRRNTSVTNRLSAVRAGASGFAVSGISIPTDNGSIPAHMLTSFFEAAAAGDDESAASDWGVFLNGHGSFGDREDAVSGEGIGWDFTTGGITLGADYRVQDSMVVGFAFDYTHTDNDLNQSAGDLEIDSFGPIVYASYFGDQWYVDVVAAYTNHRYESERNILIDPVNPGANAIDRTAKGDPIGDEFSFAGGGGYDFDFDEISVSPSIRMQYTRNHIGAFDENSVIRTPTQSEVGVSTEQGLNLHYQTQDFESLTTNLGGTVRYAISSSTGVFVPYFRASWEHEYLNNNQDLNARYVFDPNEIGFFIKVEDPDRDYMRAGAGVSANFAHGWSGFVDFDTTLFHDKYDKYEFTGGARYEF